MSGLMTTAPKTRPDRAWARELLHRAGRSQLELARAWGVRESAVSRWLDGIKSSDPSLAQAMAFCRLTGISLEELAARMGLEPMEEGTVELLPVGDPPLPTIRITPSHKAGRWLLLAHIEVGADALSGITRALDEAAAAQRVRRAREATAARVALPA